MVKPALVWTRGRVEVHRARGSLRPRRCRPAGFSLLSAISPDGRIELIEPTAEESRRRRLGDGNQARIEHIGVEVDDVPAVIEAVRGLGVEFTTAEPVPVGPNLNAWTRPEMSDGIQFQLVQRDAV